ncbi:hypothetical protein [Neisseria dumasiana]|uniref:Uncharacterized protein n=1 Tax=Neisseria dumasiana TaxID=1931275 RepID=A0A1X3DHE1_9NEIS|nr:hypothetical protein [Neisseria dumasiana]OSI20430.1 hypothetical protein BV912_07620 [Neisseria dumasiana]
MAYFANATEGSTFDSQCANCKLNFQCPIRFSQIEYNRKQLGNPLAQEIMHTLVPNECNIYRLNTSLLELDNVEEIERIRLNHIGTELPADIKQLLYKYTQMEFGK